VIEKCTGELLFLREYMKVGEDYWKDVAALRFKKKGAVI